MTKRWQLQGTISAAALCFVTLLLAQTGPVNTPAPVSPTAAAQARTAQANGRNLDEVLKRVDDVLWFTRLADIADVDKIEFTSSPPAHVTNAKAPGATNPLIIHAYTFIPKSLNRSEKQPLITFAHQGVHANFDTSDLHVIRELLKQGYSLIACDYRGSTGYGQQFFEQIDYGGREIDGVYNSTQWMLETYSSANWTTERRAGCKRMRPGKR